MPGKYFVMGLAVLITHSSLWAAPVVHLSCSDVPEGFHEWAAFGENTVFLSHLPMFGSIHSYQTIVEASLTRNGQNVGGTFFESERTNPGASFTISPVSEKTGAPAYWVLPEQIKVGASFNARLHYQTRDGKDTDLLENVQVTITRIILDRMFHSTDPRPQQLTYFYFNHGDEEYLAHLLTWDPDFDQILRVSSDPRTSSTCGMVERISFSGRPNAEENRIRPSQALSGKSDCSGTSLQLRTLNELYEYRVSIQR